MANSNESWGAASVPDDDYDSDTVLWSPRSKQRPKPKKGNSVDALTYIGPAKDAMHLLLEIAQDKSKPNDDRIRAAQIILQYLKEPPFNV